MKNKVVFISGLIWVACWVLWILFQADLWFIGNAQFIFVLVCYIHKTVETERQRFISRTFVFIALNALIDELFGDPTKIGITEYLIATAYAVYQFAKWRNGLKRSRY